MSKQFNFEMLVRLTWSRGYQPLKYSYVWSMSIGISWTQKKRKIRRLDSCILVVQIQSFMFLS